MNEETIKYEISQRLLPVMIHDVLLHLCHNDAAGWWSYRRDILSAMIGTRPWPGRPIIHLCGDPRLN